MWKRSLIDYYNRYSLKIVFANKNVRLCCLNDTDAELRKNLD